MLKEFNQIKNSNTPWTCYKDPASTLVYFVHSKCACSFYKKLFTKLNWQQCNTNDIDWDKNLVFSYIRNPLEKHRIGVLEWFYYNNKIDLLEQNAHNPDFLLMLSQAVYLDHHSMSIYEHIGDRARAVKWIPIDQPGVDHRYETIQLIEKESTIDDDTKNWFLSLLPANVSTGLKKDCYNKLMQLPVSPQITKSIDYDKCLYDAVTTASDFEPDNYQDRIKELEKLGYKNAQAQQIADSEVADGKYLNW